MYQQQYLPPAPGHGKRGLSGKAMFGIIAGVLSVAALCVAGFIYMVLQSGFFQSIGADLERGPGFAVVGDCLDDHDPFFAMIVPCTSPDAAYEVVSIVREETEQTGRRQCQERPDVDETMFVDPNFESSSATRADTLCLKDVS
jgi:hypothetical protein